MPLTLSVTAGVRLPGVAVPAPEKWSADPAKTLFLTLQSTRATT